MRQYLDLLNDIMANGTWKDPARENLPRTLSLFGTRMEFDMKDGFPLLTTKKMHYKAIIVELLWFLKGDTNIKYLIDNDCNIWNQDAYRWYLKFMNTMVEPDYDFLIDDPNNNSLRKFTLEEFADVVKHSSKMPVSDNGYTLGDLGKVYGHQWRNQNGVDQIAKVIERLKKEPEGRYAILDAWNPADFDQMALPPCHILYQFNATEIPFIERWTSVEELYDTKAGYPGAMAEDIKDGNELNEALKLFNIPIYNVDLQMYQRSVDTLLGAPFNIASGALLLNIIARIVGMQPNRLIWIGGDTHIYENHMDAVAEQLTRIPTELPRLSIAPHINDLQSLNELCIDDFAILGYVAQSKIVGKLNVGLKDED